MNSWVRQVPNLISSLRILLVIPIALTLLHGAPEATMGLFLLAAASDAADGFLAKRYGWKSAVGGVLDPAADKLLLATVFITLAWLQRVPAWLMATAVARDVIIALGALAYRVLLGPVEARPSVISKLNTLCQASYILAVVAAARLVAQPAWMLMLLGALTFQTTVISGMDYVLRYARAALAEARTRRPAGGARSPA